MGLGSLSETSPSSKGILAPLGTEVVELGLINSTIHQVDEHVLVEDLERLAQVYRHVADSML